MDKKLVEEGRKRLEELLNKEVVETKEVRKYETNLWIKDMINSHKTTFNWDDNKIKELLGMYTPEFFEKELKGNNSFIYIKTNQPYFINRGTHQAVVDLQNGLVAKGPIRFTKQEIGEELIKKFPNVLSLRGALPHTKKTIEYLNEFFKGSSIIIPEASFYNIRWDEKGQLMVDPNVGHRGYDNISEEEKKDFPSIYITQDLRENGKYKLVDYNEKIAKGLINGDNLIDEFNNAYGRLIEHSDKDIKKCPYLITQPHGFDFSSDTAIKNMFLLQMPVNKKEKGKLVLGDFDHIQMFE